MKKKLSGEAVFQIVDILLMCLFIFLIIVPIFTVVMTSFVSEAEIARRGTFIIVPEKFDFSAYKMLFASGKNIVRAYSNTLFRVFVGTGLNLMVTISLAYGLSKDNLKGKTVITGFVFFTMLFSGGLIPTFILVKGLGLIDSRWAMVLPCLVNTWNLLIMRNFFYAIPKSLEEAAVIDGANDIQILTKVVLPLSKASIATIGLFYATFIIVPEKFDFSAYKMLFASGKNIVRAYSNTLFRVFVGTGLNLMVTISLAYGLSKDNLKGKTVITGFVFFTMLFSGGLIPTFILVKGLGLIDSRWAMVLPCLVNTWNLLIMRNFFYAIPKSLEEAAVIDGANDIQILTKVVLPLSKASIATIGLFYAVSHWNAWFDAMLYINKTPLLPMQNILRNIITAASSIGDLGAEAYNSLDVVPPSQSIRAATIVITTLPILVVYPFVQKYFVKGVMVGSVKG